MTIIIYACTLIQGAVKGVNNYSDDRKSGWMPRLKRAVVRCSHLLFCWDKKYGFVSRLRGSEFVGLSLNCPTCKCIIMHACIQKFDMFKILIHN